MLRGVDLVEVRFDPAGRFVLVAPGTTLLAASQKAGVEIAFGCTRGMCGTDAVAVEPPGALEPPDATERSTLERMGLQSPFRLSCSARVRTGVVHVACDRF